MKNGLSQKVLQKIKDKKITPKPRWEFLLKDYVIWGLGILCLLVGSLAMAVIIYMIQSNNWDLYEYVSDSLAGFIFATLPYFWIALLALFILAADYNLKHVKGGYRYRLPAVVVASIVICGFLGTIFFNFSLGQTIDNAFTTNLPAYERLSRYRRDIWHKPPKGVLAGMMTSQLDIDEYEFRDLQNQMWRVDTREMPLEFKSMLKAGQPMILIGKNIGDGKFKVLIARPRPGMPGFMHPGEMFPNFRPRPMERPGF